MSTNTFTKVYSVVNRTGFLQSKLGRYIFRKAYFTYKRAFEDPFYRLVKRHPELFEGGDIIDIGANIGYCTMIFKKGLSQGKKIHSFEPAPDNFEELRNCFSSDETIILNQCCVGKEDGSIKLWLNDNHHADHRTVTSKLSTVLESGKSITVPCISLDSYVAEKNIKRVQFIKIDVQGVEELVMRGASKTIVRDRPIVVFEYSPYQIKESGFRPTELLQFFTGRSYNLSELTPSGELKKLDQSVLSAREDDQKYYIDILAEPA